MPENPDEISIDPVSPDYVIKVAEAVLAVDHQGVHTTPVGQTVIGWVIAAHDQIRAIGELTRDGRTSATSPNTRAVMEITLRLLWLNSVDDRTASLRAQFETEANHANSHPANLRKMDLPDDLINDAHQIDLERFGPLDDTLKGVARSVLNFSLQTKYVGGFYDMWHASTQYTHATEKLANAYAPQSALGFITTPDDRIDWSLHLNAISLVICSVAAQILANEGLPANSARAFFNASLTA